MSWGSLWLFVSVFGLWLLSKRVTWLNTHEDVTEGPFLHKQPARQEGEREINKWKAKVEKEEEESIVNLCDLGSRKESRLLRGKKTTSCTVDHVVYQVLISKQIEWMLLYESKNKDLKNSSFWKDSLYWNVFLKTHNRAWRELIFYQRWATFKYRRNMH